MKSKGLYAGFLTLMLIASSGCSWSGSPEVSVAIGEPWTATLQRSSIKFIPDPDPDLDAEAGEGMIAVTNARLRLIAAEHGFVTGMGREILITRDEKGQVQLAGLFLSEEHMSLVQAVEMATDLQDQLRKKGWVPYLSWAMPPIADTPGWREWLRQSRYTTDSWWRAGNHIAALTLFRIEKSAPGADGRYELRLQIAQAPSGH